ncbi:MAG: permease, partial [Anaerolineales bacterium]|nr:permease [Anaerolineales bacterium]
IIESPYRRLLEPLIAYIDQLADTISSDEMLTVVVPQFIPQHWIYNGLHMNTAVLLRKALLKRRDIVIMEVPYHLSKH